MREVLLDFGVVSREGIRSGRVATASKHELISTLHQFLLSLMAIHGSAVLIIDEAQHLSMQVLEEIRIISNLETNESKLPDRARRTVGFAGHTGATGCVSSISASPYALTLKALNREELEAYRASPLGGAARRR